MGGLVEHYRMGITNDGSHGGGLKGSTQVGIKNLGRGETYTENKHEKREEKGSPWDNEGGKI